MILHHVSAARNSLQMHARASVVSGYVCVRAIGDWPFCVQRDSGWLNGVTEREQFVSFAHYRGDGIPLMDIVF